MQFADDALLGYPPLEEQNLGQKLSQNLEVGPSLIGLPEKKMRPLPLDVFTQNILFVPLHPFSLSTVT